MTAGFNEVAHSRKKRDSNKLVADDDPHPTREQSNFISALILNSENLKVVELSQSRWHLGMFSLFDKLVGRLKLFSRTPNQSLVFPQFNQISSLYAQRESGHPLLDTLSLPPNRFAELPRLPSDLPIPREISSARDLVTTITESNTVQFWFQTEDFQLSSQADTPSPVFTLAEVLLMRHTGVGEEMLIISYRSTASTEPESQYFVGFAAEDKNDSVLLESFVPILRDGSAFPVSILKERAPYRMQEQTTPPHHIGSWRLACAREIHF